jgi:flagellum-specific ATP synthase
MTARLTRWLTTLDNFETKMAQLPSVRRYGRLTRATGLVLEATGLQLPLGATCVIERQDGWKRVKWKAKWSALTVSVCS